MSLEINKAMKVAGAMCLAIGMLMFSSCVKDELIMYNNEAHLYIEKIASDVSKDSTSYSFVVQRTETLQDTVYIKVRIMGKAAKSPREIILEPSEKSTAIAGQHYKLLPYTMPADSFKVKLPVVVMRSPDLTKKEVFLELNVVQSKDFMPGISKQLGYKIKINDFFSKPDNWDQRLAVFFGVFSEVKFAFIFKTLGMSTFAYPEQVPYSQMTYLKIKLKNALAEEEKVNGLMMDEFGNRVSFPN